MSSLQPKQVMLVDDHAVVRAGVRRLLEQDLRFTVIAEADSGESAYMAYGRYLPDLTVIDITMPGMGGIEAIQKIVTRYPNAKILVLSMHENAAFASQALKAGAKGYLAKNGLAEELINALLTVNDANIYINSSIAKKMDFQINNKDCNPTQLLSVREFEIFRMLMQGIDAKAIALTLNLSAKTVANYQTNIKQKLNVNNAVEMVRLAIRCGLVES